MTQRLTLAVLVAAGRSSRMGAGVKKPFLELEGQPVLCRAAEALVHAPSVSALVVVVRADDAVPARAMLAHGPVAGKLVAVVPGGAERTDSVRAGASVSTESFGWILVHDAARPLVRPEEVEAVIAAAREHGAAVLASPVSDTVKRSRDGRFAYETLEREGLWQAQTPQVFEAERFRAVLAQAEREGRTATDDAALWEHYVGPVALVPGARANLKLTRPEDLELARALLRAESSA